MKPYTPGTIGGSEKFQTVLKAKLSAVQDAYNFNLHLFKNVAQIGLDMDLSQISESVLVTFIIHRNGGHIQKLSRPIVIPREHLEVSVEELVQLFGASQKQAEYLISCLEVGMRLRDIEPDIYGQKCAEYALCSLPDESTGDAVTPEDVEEISRFVLMAA